MRNAALITNKKRAYRKRDCLFVRLRREVKKRGASLSGSKSDLNWEVDWVRVKGERHFSVTLFLESD